MAPRLHAVTDEAARIAQLVETFLGEECKLGLGASTDFDQHDDPRDGTEFCKRLAYGRIDGEFRLIVRAIRIDQSREEDCLSETAWANCTREVKLRSIEHIPDLLAAISKKVQFAIQQTEEATVKVNQLLQDLGIAGKEEK
jgi:hypothetical protein